MSEERKRKKKKGKDDESILENEIFHIMEVSLKEALDMALDDTKRLEVIKASYERTVVLLACLFLRFSADIFDRVFFVQSQESRDLE